MWDTQGCRTTPLRTRKWIDTSRIGKNPARASYLAEQGPYGPLTTPARAVHGLFTISKPVRGPVAYNALKLYGPHGACVGTSPEWTWCDWGISAVDDDDDDDEEEEDEDEEEEGEEEGPHCVDLSQWQH